MDIQRLQISDRLVDQYHILLAQLDDRRLHSYFHHYSQSLAKRIFTGKFSFWLLVIAASFSATLYIHLPQLQLTLALLLPLSFLLRLYKVSIYRTSKQLAQHLRHLEFRYQGYLYKFRDIMPFLCQSPDEHHIKALTLLKRSRDNANKDIFTKENLDDDLSTYLNIIISIAYALNNFYILKTISGIEIEGPYCPLIREETSQQPISIASKKHHSEQEKILNSLLEDLFKDEQLIIAG